MITRPEREAELRALLQTAQGMETVMQLYRDKTVAGGTTGSLGRIGLLACQMIPRIVDAEFPAQHPSGKSL